MTTLEGAPFVVKLYQILQDPQNSNLITWKESGETFTIWNPVEFGSQVLPRYFKHNNFCSFIRQLSTYNFVKLESDNWEFRNELFQRDRPDLLKQILRRKSKKRATQVEEEKTQTSGRISEGNNVSFQSSSSVELNVEPNIQQSVQLGQPVGHQIPLKSSQSNYFNSPNLNNLSISNSSESEIEKLKGLNNLLMKEVIRLQYQQESTNITLNQLLHEAAESKKQIVRLNSRINQLSLNNVIQESRAQLSTNEELNQFSSLDNLFNSLEQPENN